MFSCCHYEVHCLLIGRRTCFGSCQRVRSRMLQVLKWRVSSNTDVGSIVIRTWCFSWQISGIATKRQGNTRHSQNAVDEQIHSRYQRYYNAEHPACFCYNHTRHSLDTTWRVYKTLMLARYQNVMLSWQISWSATKRQGSTRHSQNTIDEQIHSRDQRY
jgi:hypothetical protein